MAAQTDAFQDHVATPHGLNFAHAAALYGARHVPVSNARALQEALRAPLAATGTTLIEVRTGREADLALHRRVAARAMAAISRSAREA